MEILINTPGRYIFTCLDAPLSFSLSHVARYAPLLIEQNVSSILRKSISFNF